MTGRCGAARHKPAASTLRGRQGPRRAPSGTAQRSVMT